VVVMSGELPAIAPSSEELSGAELAARAGVGIEEIQPLITHGVLVPRQGRGAPFRAVDVMKIRVARACEEGGLPMEGIAKAIRAGHLSFAFIDKAQVAGDLETAFSQYTDDVLGHVGGDNKLSGDYRGLEQLQAMFGRFMEASGEYSFENHAYLADDQHGIVLQHSTMRRGGQTFSTNEVFVVHFRDGQISEFWYQPWDQADVDAWFDK
jgi:ketosteroid isomerase-like protein